MDGARLRRGRVLHAVSPASTDSSAPTLTFAHTLTKELTLLPLHSRKLETVAHM
jgi:hypothetical protein